MPYTATVYSEAKFLIALEVVKSRPYLAKSLGAETLATVKDALVIAAAVAPLLEGYTDPGSAETLAMGA